MAYLIRHIAADSEGCIVAAAEFEKLIHIWDVESETKLITIKTGLDFGGKRLAISPNGDFCAVGAYNRYGVSLYSISNGSLLWNRKDLKKVQCVSFNSSDGNIIAGFDEKPLHILDSMTGNTLESIRGVRKKWTSYYSDDYMLEKAKTLNLFSNNKLVTEIARTTFAVLSTVFSPDIVIISEAGGPISAYCIKNGYLVWRNYPDVGSHFLTLGYNNQTSKIYGVLWSFKKGGPKILCSIDSSSGTITDKINLDEQTTETVFTNKGNLFITSTGDMYKLDTETPELAKSLVWE